MKASRELKSTLPFVMTQRDFERVVSLLTTNLPRLSITAKCSDGLERSFENVEDLSNYENPPRKELVSLRLRASAQDFGQVCVFRFDNDELYNVYLSVDAEEETVLALSEGFNERLSAMRPWYHLISSVNASFWLFNAPFFVLFVVVPLAKSLFRGTLSLPNLAAYPAWFYLILVVATLLMCWLYVYLDRLRHLWFPMGVFCMGQGTKRHSDRDIIRSSVIIAFVISVLATFISAPLL